MVRPAQTSFLLARLIGNIIRVCQLVSSPISMMSARSPPLAALLSSSLLPPARQCPSVRQSLGLAVCCHVGFIDGVCVEGGRREFRGRSTSIMNSLARNAILPTTQERRSPRERSHSLTL